MSEPESPLETIRVKYHAMSDAVCEAADMILELTQ